MMSDTIQVKLLSATDKAPWDAYVSAHERGTFFHLSAWQQVIEQAFAHPTYFFYAECAGKVCGVLPLAHVKSLLFGNALTSLPFCVYGGVVSDSLIVKDALIQAAMDKASQLQVDYLELKHIQSQQVNWPKKDHLYVTFRQTLDSDPEVNLKNIPRKQRAMVRKGIKAELNSVIDDEVDRFYDAYAQSVHALGTPVFAKKYFTILKDAFADRCEILTITHQQRLVSSVMSFYFRDEVLPYYGGGTPEARQVKGNDFMYWDLMRRSCERGIKVFDYGRSKVGTGSYSFKKNWGFEPQPLCYEYHLVKSKSIPDVNPLNPKYRLFIGLWKKMPYQLTKLIGPHIVKNLG